MTAADEPKPLGVVRWEVTDASSGAILARGDAAVQPADISVRITSPVTLSQAVSGFKPASRGRLRNRLASAGVQLAVATASMLTGGSQPYYGKRLRLDSTYSLVLIERPRRRSGNRRSFALAAGRADIETLAMFHSGDDGVAASSRDDEPRLVIETAPNTKQAYEIVHTTFSAETVLPIEPAEADLGDGHAEQLELRILPGTSISWPLGSVIRLRPQLRPKLDLG